MTQKVRNNMLYISLILALCNELAHTWASAAGGQGDFHTWYRYSRWRLNSAIFRCPPPGIFSADALERIGPQLCVARGSTP